MTISNIQKYKINKVAESLWTTYRIPINSKKEIYLIEALNNIPAENIKEKIYKSEEKTGKKITDDKVSGLNPKSEMSTEKDPDELIMLPKEELRKTYNKKNKNQPL